HPARVRQGSRCRRQFGRSWRTLRLRSCAERWASAQSICSEYEGRRVRTCSAGQTSGEACVSSEAVTIIAMCEGGEDTFYGDPRLLPREVTTAHSLALVVIHFDAVTAIQTRNEGVECGLYLRNRVGLRFPNQFIHNEVDGDPVHLAWP